MTATSRDYLWLDAAFGDWTRAYCLTLVSDLTPEGLIAALGTAPNGVVVGVKQLVKPSYRLWDTPEAGSRLLVGVGGFGPWAVMAEANGYVGVTAERMRPISRGRHVVSHYVDVNAVDRFAWWADGETRLDFEPLVPQLPADVPADLRQQVVDAGIVLDGDDDEFHQTEAAFALAERLTGVRITPDLLTRMMFATAVVDLGD
jgi:hypothetical protein